MPRRSRDVVVHALAFAGTSEQCPGTGTDARLSAVVDHAGGNAAPLCDDVARAAFFQDVLADIAAAP